MLRIFAHHFKYNSRHDLGVKCPSNGSTYVSGGPECGGVSGLQAEVGSCCRTADPLATIPLVATCITVKSLMLTYREVVDNWICSLLLWTVFFKLMLPIVCRILHMSINWHLYSHGQPDNFIPCSPMVERPSPEHYKTIVNEMNEFSFSSWSEVYLLYNMCMQEIRHLYGLCR